MNMEPIEARTMSLGPLPASVMGFPSGVRARVKGYVVQQRRVGGCVDHKPSDLRCISDAVMSPTPSQKENERGKAGEAR